jgi:DNA adenine methylase
MPKEFDRDTWIYREPFLGSGALFLALEPRFALVSDASFPLINAWELIQGNVYSLVDRLQKSEFDLHTEEEYYTQRDLFRSEMKVTERTLGAWGWGMDDRILRLSLAARFIYLNKTCYNGLCRSSKLSGFNVPWGNLKNPKIFDAQELRELWTYLAGMDNCIDIRYVDFWASLRYKFFIPGQSIEGTFAYLDPPYDTDTDQHTTYTAGGFTKQNQEELRDVANERTKDGWRIMVSNANTPFIRQLYEGWRIVEISAPRSIAANGNRDKVKELLIMNY